MTIKVSKIKTTAKMEIMMPMELPDSILFHAVSSSIPFAFPDGRNNRIKKPGIPPAKIQHQGLNPLESAKTPITIITITQNISPII